MGKKITFIMNSGREIVGEIEEIEMDVLAELAWFVLGNEDEGKLKLVNLQNVEEIIVESDGRKTK